jgi:OFA family oxalate/formate antiporter-like MFS transporter
VAAKPYYNQDEMMKTRFPKHDNRRRTAILIAGTAAMMTLGVIFIWSIFAEPIENEFGWTRSQTSLTFSIALISFSLGMMFNGATANRIPEKIGVLVGIAFILCGFVLCLFTQKLVMLYICYGVFGGFGLGICYNNLVASVLAWFPDRIGFATGALLTGYGLGSVLWGFPVSTVVHSTIGWRWAFVFLGIAVSGMNLFAFWFIKKPPSDVFEQREETVSDAIDYSARQMVGKMSFWIFIVWKSFPMGALCAIVAQAFMLISEIGGNVQVATFAVAAINIGNGSFRLLAGILNDKLGQQKTLIALPALLILFSLLLAYAYRTQNIPGVILSLLILGALYGGYALMNIAFVRINYGQIFLNANVGLSSLLFIPFTLCFPMICAFSFERTGSYHQFLFAVPFIAFVSFVSAIMVRPFLKTG